jgi:lipoyl(octanoyl) transferase
MPSATVTGEPGGVPTAVSGGGGLAVEWLGRMGYDDALARQRATHAARVAGEVGDTLLLVEHEPVYTAGRRTEAWERPAPGAAGRVLPVIDVDRGGRITWHGPGQLTGYPIVALDEPVDVVAHVRRLEAALIVVCDGTGVSGAGRVEGRSGVWLPADPATGRPERKIAAIGVRVARGVTMHGFALNCDCDLSAFAAIIPCGITDAGVTSITAEVGHDVGIPDVVDVVVEAVGAQLRSGRA